MMLHIKHNVLVVGCIRNASHSIYRDYKIFVNAFKSCSMLRFFWVESDSNDQTVLILNEISKENNRFKFVSLGKLIDKFPARTERLAYCRNRYLIEIKTNPDYFDVDYVVVADFDGINSKLTEAAVRSCFSRNDWDVCCANQSGPYYDIYALRHPLWSPVDCWQQAKFILQLSRDEFSATVGAVYSKMISIPEGAPWIEVDSAFGGLAIYKKDVLLKGQYSGIDDNGFEVCEHVSLHREIKAAGGRIFINPKLINAGLVSHSFYATSFGLPLFFVRCKIKSFLRKVVA